MVLHWIACNFVVHSLRCIVMNRKTNQELCNEFRSLLTDKFYVMAESPVIDQDVLAKALALTKPWRNDIWKAFAELERRLCPAPDVALADAVKLVSEAIKEENNGS